MQGIILISIFGVIILGGLMIAPILNHFTYYKPREKFANAIREHTDLAVAYSKYSVLFDDCFDLCKKINELKKEIERKNEELPFIPSCNLKEYTKSLDEIKLNLLIAKDEYEACIVYKNKAREEVNDLLMQYTGLILDDF